MLLMLQNLVSKTPGGDLMFFQEAYYWCFQKENGHVWPDVLAWRTSGTIPLYISRYVQHLESLDSEGAHGL